MLAKFYGDVIVRSHLQFINTLINTFFSKLFAFLTELEEKRPDIRKLDGGVGESSMEQQIHKSDVIVQNLEPYS